MNKKISIFLVSLLMLVALCPIVMASGENAISEDITEIIGQEKINNEEQTNKSKGFSLENYSPDEDEIITYADDTTYTEGNYALTMNNENLHLINGSKEINDTIENTAQKLNIKYKKGTTLCTEVFDTYMTDSTKLFERIPKDINIIGAEMEAFALFYNAKVLNKKAACILTVVDDRFHDTEATSEDREKSLNDMIELALNSAIEI